MRGAVRERKKARQPASGPPCVTEEMVKKQLSTAAGTEAFQHRDPIYHLNESFRQTFDLMGQQRARGDRPDLDSMLQVYMQDESPGLWGKDDAGTQTDLAKSRPGIAGFSEDFLHKTSMNTDYEPRDWDPQRRVMDRFADISFQRGRLSAAVIRGTGKMMLFSCLERTVGQQDVKQRKERKLFQSSSAHQMIPGRREDISITNRGFADSAVGLVVDVLKDARQVVDSLTALAEGKGGPDGMGTLHKQYPFLTDAPERELLEQYRARLEELKGPGHEEEREVLKRAQEKAVAIIAKKDQMKRDFLQRLRQLSHSAAEAEAAFTSEEFLRQAAQRLEPEKPEEPEQPPNDDGGETGDGGREPR